MIRALGGQVITLGRGRGHLNILDPGEAIEAAERLRQAGKEKERAQVLADAHGRRHTMVSALLTILRKEPPTDREESIIDRALRPRRAAPGRAGARRPAAGDPRGSAGSARCRSRPWRRHPVQGDHGEPGGVADQPDIRRATGGDLRARDRCTDATRPPCGLQRVLHRRLRHGHAGGDPPGLLVGRIRAPSTSRTRWRMPAWNLAATTSSSSTSCGGHCAPGAAWSTGSTRSRA